MVNKHPDIPIAEEQEESLVEIPEHSTEKPFSGFAGYEYNLFWALQLLIIFCTIYLVGGNFEHCLQVFLKVINPVTWM